MGYCALAQKSGIRQASPNHALGRWGFFMKEELKND